MNLRAVRALTLGRLRELSREPGTLFWAFGFPLLLSLGLGLAFREPTRQGPGRREAMSVGVAPGTSETTVSLLRAGGFALVEAPEEALGRDLRDGRVDVVVEEVAAPGHPPPPAPPWPVRFRYDDARPASRLARAEVNDLLQRAAGRRDPRPVEDAPVFAPGQRYIDFLVPGLIGMNIMSGTLWTLAFAVVSFRVRKLMKRLLATPLRPHELMASFLLARLLILPLEIAVLLAVTRAVFALPFRGSPLLLLAVSVLGCLSFGGLATLLASRAPNVETVTGLMNAVMLPMFVASGVFFPTSRFPGFVQPALALLPLSALNRALRAIVLEGAGPTAVAGPCLCLALWGGVAGAWGLRRFRWR